MVRARDIYCQIPIVLRFYVGGLLSWLWFLVACVAILLIVPFRWKDPSLGAVFARMVGYGARFFLGLRVEVENEKGLYLHQPCVYIGNHQTNVDVFTYAVMYPYRTVVIGKKELLRVPLFGLLFMATGNILIDRADKKHSYVGLDKASNEIKARKVSVWIFPEGTRNHGAREMLPFKKGGFYLAVKTQEPIVAIVHEPMAHYFDFKRARLGGRVRIRVLEPILTKGLKESDIPKLMQTVRARMEAALQELSLQG